MSNSKEKSIDDFLYEDRVEYTIEDIGSQTMEIISKGLYSDPFHLIREYVQNAVDAKPRDSITISIQGRDIFVHDRGCGLDEQRLNEAKQIGITSKNFAENVGFRGIGIWSALGVAEKLILTTSIKGEDKKRILVINFDDIMKGISPQKSIKEVLDKNVRILVCREDPDVYGTTAEIRNIKSEVIGELLDKSRLKSYIRQNLPVPFPDDFIHKEQIEKLLETNVPEYNTYLIKLDGEPIHKNFTNNVEPPQYNLITNDEGSKIAFYFACLHEKDEKIKDSDCRGLTYRIRGFCIGDNATTQELFRVDKHLADWYFGEIHVFHSQLKPDAERGYFEATPMRKIFIEKAQDAMDALRSTVRNRSAKNKADNRISKASGGVEKILDEISSIKDDETAYKKKHELEGLEECVTKDITPRKSGKRKGERNCSPSYVSIGEDVLENINVAIKRIEERIEEIKKGALEEELKPKKDIEELKPREEEEEVGTFLEGEKEKREVEAEEGKKEEKAKEIEGIKDEKEKTIEIIEKEILENRAKKDATTIITLVLDVLREKLQNYGELYNDILSTLRDKLTNE